MVAVRVNVLGAARLEVDGAPIRLAPLTTRLLVRLVAAEGAAVPVGQLRRDVWGVGDGPRQARRGRNEVQKRILELRRAMDPTRTGDANRLLRTEQVFTAQVPEAAYRLMLAPSELDCAEFTDLVDTALRTAPVSAAAPLTRALGLWRGRPLAEAGDAPYADALAQRLSRQFEAARHALLQAHRETGHLDLALPLAEQLARERPDDTGAATAVDMLRQEIRRRHGGEMIRREFTDLHTVVRVVQDDLFDQHDANLVVGFTDTFDTATRDDIVISRESVQGQLVERLFGGRHSELDAALRRGLRNVTPVGREKVRDKPRGKRTRYPVGTVVAIPFDGRRIFATAYSRLGNDLVARSDADGLRLSLDRLWISAARGGLLKPVAVPLLGSGLARILEYSPQRLIMLIVETFLHACRTNPPVAPELRIVLQSKELERVQIADIAREIDALSHIVGGGRSG